jgi:hypothetical protein
MSFQGGFGSKPSAAIATGVRVVATDTSRHGHYSTGDTGVICRLNPNDPVVRWDRSGQEHQTSHGKLASGVAAAAWLAQLLQAKGITLVAFDFDGVIVPVTTHENATEYHGAGQSTPVAEGFLALAHALTQLPVPIRMVIVTANREDTVIDVLLRGQPSSVTGDPRWLAVRAALTHVIGKSGRGPDRLPVPGRHKNGKLRLVSHLAKLMAHDDGDGSLDTITPAQVLLVDDHRPNRTAWCSHLLSIFGHFSRICRPPRAWGPRRLCTFPSAFLVAVC